jgi:hypothetical protein
MTDDPLRFDPGHLPLIQQPVAIPDELKDE